MPDFGPRCVVETRFIRQAPHARHRHLVSYVLALVLSADKSRLSLVSRWGKHDNVIRGGGQERVLTELSATREHYEVIRKTLDRKVREAVRRGHKLVGESVATTPVYEALPPDNPLRVHLEGAVTPAPAERGTAPRLAPGTVDRCRGAGAFAFRAVLACGA